MPMVYVTDNKTRTYAIPSHIIEDFEISNVRLENGHSGGARPPDQDVNGLRLAGLFAALEVDITVGELSSVLSMRGQGPANRGPLGGLAPTLCGGLQGGDALSGYTDIRGLPPTLCGGLQGGDSLGTSAQDLTQWVQFFTDPRLQHVKLRLKANQLKSFLYNAGQVSSLKR